MKPGLSPEGDERFARQAMTGYAMPGVELRVVDSNDQDVPKDRNSIGEIVARSDGVMQGYWQQPESTAQAMRGGWFHTGDMATWGEDGYLVIVDRKKDIIISGGENISSLEVEKAILSHPAVMEAAVIPVPDKVWGEVPKALVVLRPNSHAGEIELIEHCRSHLAHYKCPRSVELRDTLPKTGTGKILKRDLRKPYWQGQEVLRSESEPQEGKAAQAKSSAPNK
jgi:fatty-acyl-CoA synthase